MTDSARPDPPVPTGEALILAALSQASAAGDLEDGALCLLEGLQGTLGVSGGLVAALDPGGARILASTDLPCKWLDDWRGSPSEPGIVREPGHETLEEAGVRCLWTIPLGPSGEEPAGVLVLASDDPDAFPDEAHPALEAAATAFGAWLELHLRPGSDEPGPAGGDEPSPPDALATSLGAVAVISLDREGRIREAGSTFGRLVGAAGEGLGGAALESVFAPEDGARLRKVIGQAGAEGFAALSSVRVKATAAEPGESADPEEHALRRVDLILTKRNEEEIVAFALPVVDVVAATGVGEGSDSKARGEKGKVVLLDRGAIEASEQWLQWSSDLLSVLGGATIVLDPGGRIIELGEGWLGGEDGRRSEWIGRHAADLFEAERRDVLGALRTVAREGQWTGRFPVHGTSVPIFLKAVRSADGRLEALAGALLPERPGIVDSPESPSLRPESSRALPPVPAEPSRPLPPPLAIDMPDLFRKIPAAMILVDRDLCILDANPKLLPLLGSDALPDDPKGLDVRSLAPFQVREVLGALESLPEARGFDLSEVRLAGGDRVVQLGGQELEDSAGKPIGFVLSLVERAARTRLERRIAHSQKMESIGNFASGLAHDFGNPVSVILGKAHVLRKKLAGVEDATRDLLDIEVAAKRAQHLAQDLVRFARGGRDRVSTIYLNQLVEEVNALVRTSVGTDIEVHFDLAEGLPAVEGDETELQQMVLNLCLNARDAMEEGGLLTVETRALTPEQVSLLENAASVENGVCLVVKDAGKGMPPEVCEHIFEPFFSTKADPRGTGLGLAMVYAIVRRHGGVIDVESRVGEGTRFEVLLPGAIGVAAESPTALQVLVVDDEPAFREMIRLILEDEGHQVKLAANGEEALKTLRADYRELGLVILDLKMPGIDGLSVLEELRSLAPGLPVLVTTGYASEEEKEQAVNRGAKRILEKPYRVNELRNAVAELMGIGRAPAPGSSAAAGNVPEPVEDAEVPAAAASIDAAGSAAERLAMRTKSRWSGVFQFDPSAARPPSEGDAAGGSEASE